MPVVAVVAEGTQETVTGGRETTTPDVHIIGSVV